MLAEALASMPSLPFSAAASGLLPQGAEKPQPPSHTPQLRVEESLQRKTAASLHLERGPSVKQEMTLDHSPTVASEMEEEERLDFLNHKNFLSR